MNFIKACLPFLHPHKRWVVLILVCAMLETAFVSLSPLSFKYLIDEAFIPKDSNMFIFILTILLIGGVVAVLAGFASDYAMAALSGKVAYNLRTKTFSKIQRLALSDYDRFGIGSLVSRFQNDIPSIGGMTAYLLPSIFNGILSVIIGVFILFQLQWKLTLLMMISSSILFIGPLFLKKHSKLASEQFKQTQEAFIDLVDEGVKSHRLIKGFQLADLMDNRAKPRVHAILKSGIRMNLLFSLMQRIPGTTLLFLSGVMIVAGGYFIFQDELSVGAFIAMNAVFLSVSQSTLSLSLLWPQLFEAEVSLDRVNELLHSRQQEQSKAFTGKLPEAIQDISFNQVHYRYTEEQFALKDISLTIPAGGLTVFVGTSGSGKSTALQLLLRFLQPSQGTIHYGESDINRSITDSSFYEQIAVVFQESHFLHMSIKDNLILGSNQFDIESVVKAAKLSQIHETIMSLPEKYDTIIKNNASHLSGGQRQRLAIARALAKNPNYLLLDEACSALDPATEADINTMIEELRGSKTIISVTHRLMSAVRADRIFVFHNGKVVETGTHTELLKQDGTYKQLWDKQNGIEVSSDGFGAKVTVSRLSQFSFFKGLDDEILFKISNQFVSEQYYTRQTIIVEGEVGDKFYLIARGAVEVIKGFDDDKEIVAVLQDGDHFGEIALLRNIPRTATVIAKVPSLLLSLRRDQLLELTYSNQKIYDMLERVLEERIRLK